MSAGIKVFSTLEEAKAAGFVLYDKTPDGFLVRRDDGHSYSLALVKIDRPAPTDNVDKPS
jgi:hypothetical protein